jgi:hypothetical protein
MPYCSKCGTKLDEDPKFCPNCGTSAGPPMSEPRAERRKPRSISTFAIFLIAVVLAAGILTAIAFMPFYEVGPLENQMSAPRELGVDTLNLDLTADVAKVAITFESLEGELQSPGIILNAWASARVGIFSSSDFLERYMPVWNTETEGNVLTVTATQKTDGFIWPLHSSLNVTFNIVIDPLMNTSLNINTVTGGIILKTQAGVVLNSLNLKATTGGVEAQITESIVAADVSIKTTTGGVRLSWDNVIVANSVKVNVTTTTGGLDISVEQFEKLDGNVALKGEAVTGGVAFAVDIKGEVGAKIETAVTTGGVNIDRQIGFTGTKALLQSSNYPADHNFDVSLRTTTGGISIDAEYTP